MADAKYDVEINFKKVGDGWDDLSAGVGKFTGVLDSAMGKIGHFAEFAAVGLGAGLFAGAIYGVTKLNAEAERAQISIAGMFSANGLATSVPQGMTMAKDTIAQMRKDVQALPVEFKDLQQVFQMGAVPMFQAGLNAEQAEKLAVKASAVGATMNLDQGLVAREFGMLLSGRAGAHNKFGTMLGFSGAEAKHLNAEDPAKRAKDVTAAMSKYDGVLDEFKTSFTGMETTLIDHMKNFGRAATAPLFEEVKDTLGEVNKWYGENQQTVAHWTTELGTDLRDAFRWGKSEITEWYPIVENFAEVAMHRIEDFWDEVKPGVMAFGQAFKEALEDPNGTLDKLKHILELYAAIKIGGGLLEAGGALSGMAKGAGGIFNGLGLLGAGGKAAEGAAGATRGVGLEYGEIAFGGAAAAKGTGAATSAFGLDVGAAGVGAVFLAAVAAWGVAIYQGVELADEVHAQDMANKNAKAEAHGREISEMIRAGATSAELDARMKALADSYGEQTDAFGNVTKFADTAGWALNDVATSAAIAASALAGIGGAEQAGDKRADDIGDAAGKALGLALFANAMGQKGSWDAAASAASAKKKAPTMKGGHGGTSIQKVEIVVTSNQSPSRIARAVHADLAKLSQNRRASPFVRNFSARDE